MKEEKIDSRYSRIDIPEFISEIPAHLVHSLDEKERYMIETFSILQQQSKWIIQTLVDGNRIHLDLDIRISRIEKWKDAFTPKWAMVSAGGLMILSSGLTAVFQRLFIHH